MYLDTITRTNIDVHTHTGGIFLLVICVRRVCFRRECSSKGPTNGTDCGRLPVGLGHIESRMSIGLQVLTATRSRFVFGRSNRRCESTHF